MSKRSLLPLCLVPVLVLGCVAPALPGGGDSSEYGAKSSTPTERLRELMQAVLADYPEHDFPWPAGQRFDAKPDLIVSPANVDDLHRAFDALGETVHDPLAIPPRLTPSQLMDGYLQSTQTFAARMNAEEALFERLDNGTTQGQDFPLAFRHRVFGGDGDLAPRHLGVLRGCTFTYDAYFDPTFSIMRSFAYPGDDCVLPEGRMTDRALLQSLLEGYPDSGSAPPSDVLAVRLAPSDVLAVGGTVESRDAPQRSRRSAERSPTPQE